MRQPASTLADRAPSRAPVEIRPLLTEGERRACVALQRRIWGEDFAEIVPSSILKISQRLGGVADGAFDDRGTLVGFVFGITGVENGAIVHWSDMLAVAPEVRNRGIGRLLKEHQRKAVAAVGAKVIYWTFDPLVARNAHLNFNVFGVRVIEYVEEMYGESSSPLHHGIGTDRFVVAWPVDDEELAARRGEIARLSHTAGAGVVRIEIPSDVEEVQSTDANAASAWRKATRASFQNRLADGYSIQGFEIDREARRGRYLLTR